MDLGQLEKLRLMNQNLLKQLKENQEGFRRCLHGKSLPPSLQSKIETLQTRQVSDPQMGKEKQGQALEDLASIAMRTPREAGPPSKPTMPHKEEKEEGEIVHQVCPHPDSCWIDKTSMPPVKEAESAQAAGKIVKNGNFLRDPERKSTTVSPREAEMHPAPEGDGETSGVESKQEQAKGSRGPIVSARMPQAPKAILLAPPCKETKRKTKKATGRVTFVPDPEEYLLTPDEWSVRPFLGYDWIAGLLDVESSMSEKPEQYFSELQDFRKVNQDACIYDGYLKSEALGSSVPDHQSETETPSHQCIFCYHLNKRLFAVPLDSEAACPICKTPRAQQPPETLVEPAFVRVSIPRSTLLPAYKHKIHRRKSYEPADDLALPSHCLAGWENPIQASSPTLSSLDLRTILAAKPSGPLERNSLTGVLCGSRTDELLNLSHVTAFELSNVSRLWRHQMLPTTQRLPVTAIPSLPFPLGGNQEH